MMHALPPEVSSNGAENGSSARRMPMMTTTMMMITTTSTTNYYYSDMEQIVNGANYTLSELCMMCLSSYFI